MINLTAHFTQEELGVRGCVPSIVLNAAHLCETILEPIRQHYGAPVHITSGHRDASHNARVGGKPHSWHLYDGTHAAADFIIPGIDLVSIFDWIRLQSKLPFDEVILEHDLAKRPRCIHIQCDRVADPRRWAMLGSVGDAHDYIPVEVNA